MANETMVGGYRYRTLGRARSDVQRFMPGIHGVWGGGGWASVDGAEATLFRVFLTTRARLAQAESMIRRQAERLRGK